MAFASHEGDDPAVVEPPERCVTGGGGTAAAPYHAGVRAVRHPSHAVQGQQRAPQT